MTRSSRRLAGVLLCLCLLAVGVLVLGPIGGDLQDLTVDLQTFFHTDVPIAPARVSADDYGRLLNVLLFIPVGVTLAWWLDERWGWALPAAIGLSVLIEGIQSLPVVTRQASLDDVACNAIGACVGVVIVAAWRSSVRDNG